MDWFDRCVIGNRCIELVLFVSLTVKYSNLATLDRGFYSLLVTLKLVAIALLVGRSFVSQQLTLAVILTCS
jgi:hypothetical protein